MGRRRRARKSAPKPPPGGLCRASGSARRSTTPLLPGSGPSLGPIHAELALIANTACPPLRTRHRGGGASKSQPRPTIAGRPIYLGGQASSSHLPGRGGRSRRGAGRWWGRAGLHCGGRPRRDGFVRIPLAPGDGGQDHVADDPPGTPSSLPPTRAGGARLVPGRALS